MNDKLDPNRLAANDAEGVTRRKFVAAGSTVAMAGGLAAGYGTLGVIAGRFLYPDDNANAGWQFVAKANDFTVGEAIEYVAPNGAKVVIARQGDDEQPGSFVALSSVCPHLGCQVHWQPQNDRFFCPCHNGAFDAEGKATKGPPAKANQQLVRFHVKVEDGLLYVEVPLEPITT